MKKVYLAYPSGDKAWLWALAACSILRKQISFPCQKRRMCFWSCQGMECGKGFCLVGIHRTADVMNWNVPQFGLIWNWKQIAEHFNSWHLQYDVFRQGKSSSRIPCPDRIKNTSFFSGTGSSSSHVLVPQLCPPPWCPSRCYLVISSAIFHYISINGGHITALVGLLWLGGVSAPISPKNDIPSTMMSMSFAIISMRW